MECPKKNSVFGQLSLRFPPPQPLPKRNFIDIVLSASLIEGPTRNPDALAFLASTPKCKHFPYRRGIGVGVKGVTGRDAIVHKRRRNSSH